MTKRISRRNQEELLIHKWWVQAAAAVVFIAVAAGLASLAIDSGNLAEYALCIFFLGWAVNQIVRAVQYATNR